MYDRFGVTNNETRDKAVAVIKNNYLRKNGEFNIVHNGSKHFNNFDHKELHVAS